MTAGWDDLITEHGSRGSLVLVHGQPKVGKSTLFASAPNVLFLMTEHGLGRTDALKKVPALNVQNWARFVEIQGRIAKEPTKFNWIVIDSIDHLEHHEADEVARLNGAESLSKIGFNKGPMFLADHVKVNVLPWFRYLQDHGTNIALIAHSDAVSENAPDQATAFKKWVPKLNKPVIELFREEADIIGYANRPVITQDAKGGFGAAKATGLLDRRLSIQPNGAYLAGCRYDTAGHDYVPLEWQFIQAIIDGTLQPPT